MYLAYSKKISLLVKKTHINTSKIDGFILAIIALIIKTFMVNNKEKKIKFLKNSFIWLTLTWI